MAWETSALSVYLFRALGLQLVLDLRRALRIHALLDTLCTGPCQVALVVKSLPAKAGDIGDAALVPGSGRSPGGGSGNPLQYLAWRIPWTGEPGGLQPEGRAGFDTTEMTEHTLFIAAFFISCVAHSVNRSCSRFKTLSQIHSPTTPDPPAKIHQVQQKSIVPK